MTHTLPWYADFDITDPQIGFQQLAGVLNQWETDIAYVQQLSCLTQLTHLSCTAESGLGSLEELQQLSLLQTLRLSRLSAVSSHVHNFKFVQSLRLYGIEEEVCNIESYTQLTQLQIQCKDTMKEILLPFGHGVQLQSLSICGASHEHTFCLKNLTWATHLKEMGLGIESPQNFEQVNLSALLFLTQLQVSNPDHALLQTLSLCSSLKSMYVACHKQTTLPSSFSLLTQLKRLHINLLSFAQFPDCLLHLSQLESLFVVCNEPALHLSNSILCLAKWPNLKSLSIGRSAQSLFPVESQLLLCQLRKQLRDCNSSCEFFYSQMICLSFKMVVTSCILQPNVKLYTCLEAAQFPAKTMSISVAQ